MRTFRCYMSRIKLTSAAHIHNRTGKSRCQILKSFHMIHLVLVRWYCLQLGVVVEADTLNVQKISEIFLVITKRICIHKTTSEHNRISLTAYYTYISRVRERERYVRYWQNVFRICITKRMCLYYSCLKKILKYFYLFILNGFSYFFKLDPHPASISQSNVLRGKFTLVLADIKWSEGGTNYLLTLHRFTTALLTHQERKWRCQLVWLRLLPGGWLAGWCWGRPWWLPWSEARRSVSWTAAPRWPRGWPCPCPCRR